ncbi:MAG: Uncharacterized protein G01um101416_57 [Microgenomates group bacterium Gr01-1014_16]|nr:MAG: Uncharacterized protein G01um101416_57 [Microgenomates group bacterium Gr01-1014_16]
MRKLKFLVRLGVVWAALLAAFALFSVYQEIKENKLFNYTDTYASSEVKVKPEYEPNTTLKYTFNAVSHDSYLGSISFNYFRLKGNPGQVIFRIKEARQNKWYAENRYDFSYFNNDDDYQFGFPTIADSKNKEFVIEFEIVTPNLTQKQNILDLRAVPILTAKYVFPRDTPYKSPGKLMTILVNRSASVIAGMDYVKVGTISFVIALLSTLAIYRKDSGIKSEIVTRQKDLQNYVHKINPFFVPAGVLIILSLAFISGNFLLAQRMAVYLWITLFGSVIFYILQVTVLNRLARMGKLFNKISVNMLSTLDDLMTKRALLLLGILFVFVSGLSTTYYLGGDDTRIFYLYPQEFLNNYASKIVSDTGLSQLTNSIPPSSLSAFLIILVGLKKILPIFNLQALLYSANIMGGFFAFYYLIGYLLRPQGKHERVICIIASFMYVFSIFNFYTLFNSRLMAEYLISLFPLSLHLGIKAVREGKFYFLVAAVLIWSAFNFISVTFPLSAAALITSLPLLVFATWKHKVRLAAYLALAGLLFVILNLHWFAYVPYTNFAQALPGSYTPSITSVEFRKQNEAGIRAVTEINNSFFPLLNSYHQKIQLANHWPQLPIYFSWYSKILISGYLLIAVIIIAGLVIEKDKTRTSLYVAAMFSFTLAIYFFTVNIGPWGISIFLWLSNHIPGFVIFRNMYDKFAYGLAFQWALVISVSLAIVVKSIKSEKHKAYLLFAVFLISVLNAKPFILGEFENLPYWTSLHSYDGIRAFNRDYQDMLKFVKNQNSAGRYLSLPLLSGNSVIVPDEFRKDHYYAGVSPLLLLAGKNDMSGLISFADKAKDVFHWLENMDYGAIGRLLRQYNVRYVIVSNSTPEDLQNTFMFSDGLFALQPPKFIASLIGNKIKDFGSRYSLYEINPKYRSEKIYISDSPATFANHGAKLSFKKNAAHSYDIEISDLTGQHSLIFLDPHLKKWQLITQSGKQLAFNIHHVVFDYANMWEIDPRVIKSDFPVSDYQIMPDGSLRLKLKLYFQPYDYFATVNTISAGAYLLGIIFVLKSLLRPRHQ